MIESAYNDYLKRIQFKPADKKQSDKNNSFVIQLDSTTLNTTQTNIVEIDKNIPHLFEPIDFTNAVTNENTQSQANDRISYEFIIGTNNFLMNFNDMVQINQKTNTKRQMLRITLDGKILPEKKREFLRDNHSDKDIAGIIFPNK